MTATATTPTAFVSDTADLIPNCAVTLTVTGSEVGTIIDGLAALIAKNPAQAALTGLARLHSDLLDWYIA